MATHRERVPVALVSCYELGHQPVGLASPLAFLKRAGIDALGLDLAVESADLSEGSALRRARFIGISVPMHTALRLGLRLLAAIRRAKCTAHVCFFGLYASLNEEHLFDAGADSVIGGEYEEGLVDLVTAIDRGEASAIEGVSTRAHRAAPVKKRLAYVTPERGGLPKLERYARLEHRGTSVLAGYVEATRGCLHECLHCPITPVYEGRFFAVPVPVVIDDALAQVRAGARHITFGDPDFLNGPSHALRVARALHDAAPGVTFDFTTKVEHILRYSHVVAELATLGGLFVVSAFESTSDLVLRNLEKGHDQADATEALRIVRARGMTLRPTWVPFTPWTTREDVAELFDFVEREDLVDCVSPVQYGIRLLVPPGSALLRSAAMKPHLGALDSARLTYEWTHPDPSIDHLQRAIARLVESAESDDESATFERVKALVIGDDAAARGASRRSPRGLPRLTEPWFC